jgi:hypothetical protein
LFPIAVLERDIFTFNPPKLLHLLPEYLQEAGVTGRGACGQEANAKDLGWLRRRRIAERKEHGAKREGGEANDSGFLLLPVASC